MGLDCDGVDDQITFGDLAGVDGASAMSILLWYNPDLVTGDQDIVIKSSVSTNACVFVQDVDDVKVYHGDGTITAITGGAVLATGRWVHIAYVYDGAGSGNAGRQKIYINGVNETLTFAGTIPATLGDAGTAVFSLMGGSASGGVGFGDGKVAHFKVWVGTALTAAQAAQEMYSYRPANRTNLVIWSPFDDGGHAGPAARDYSGNKNHGTVTGARLFGGPPQIPHQERFIAQKHRRVGLGPWGHRILVK